jgi:uncharacterized protein (DUF983 family)
MSNYPPGFGSARDLDHVEGPLTEDDIEGTCPQCGEDALTRLTWRSGGTQIACAACDYEQDEGEEE